MTTKNNGIIPPHFIYFLEHEEIEVINYKSGDCNNPYSYDRAIVKFPFANTTFDIQIIFSNLDYSLPPDFIPLVNCDQLILNYSSLVKNWNFRESSTLYYTLKKIKEEYTNIMVKKAIDFLDDKNSNHMGDLDGGQNEDIYYYLRDWFNFFYNKSKNVEVYLNFDQKYEMIFSYNVDISIRSRNIERKPILIIVTDMANMTYSISLKVPQYISIDSLDLKFNESFKDLRNFKNIVNKYELNILEYFQKMANRELLTQKILNMSK